MNILKINPNKTCYIFDVDGTLTKPREQVTKKFKRSFINWSKEKQLFISTGSDFTKTKEQLPQDMLDCFQLIYCCMGNETRTPKGTVIEKEEFIMPEELRRDLEDYLKTSPFPYRTGNHLEARTGMLNFSIIGRNADKNQRNEYHSWDMENNERKELAEYVNKTYPGVEASVGGSISIDIISRGKDKGQVIHKLKKLGMKEVVFYGDKCYEGGNDFGILRELKNSDLNYKWFNVDGPKEVNRLINL